jgi:hypothetical protein
VSAEVARGNAVDVVVEAAKEVDLVVMASHGRSGLAALWSASIGSGVQARAETPLLLLNPSRRGLTPPAPGQLEDAPTSRRRHAAQSSASRGTLQRGVRVPCSISSRLTRAGRRRRPS